LRGTGWGEGVEVNKHISDLFTTVKPI
jgi:hypothetical protein